MMFVAQMEDPGLGCYQRVSYSSLLTSRWCYRVKWQCKTSQSTDDGNVVKTLSIGMFAGRGRDRQKNEKLSAVHQVSKQLMLIQPWKKKNCVRVSEGEWMAARNWLIKKQWRHISGGGGVSRAFHHQMCTCIAYLQRVCHSQKPQPKTQKKYQVS